MRYIKFKETLDIKNEQHKIEYENAIIVPYIEVQQFFTDNIETFKNGGPKGRSLLNKYPQYHKSLLHYTYPEKKLNGRIYELVYGIPKCQYCNKRTSFLNLDKGYSSVCKEHVPLLAAKNKGQNSVNQAIDLIISQDNFNEFEFIKIPEKLNDNFILRHHNCGKEFDLWLRNGKLSGYSLHCQHCKTTTISAQEYEIRNYLETLNIKHEYQYPLGLKKLDIYIPECNIAIEHHGPDHSFGKDTFSRFDNYLLEDKNVHLNRHHLCQEHNIRLFHIFHPEWSVKYKREIIKSMISSMCNKNESVYGRKCQIKPVNAIETSNFTNQNHIQGEVRSSIRLGLYYNNELVSLMTFGRPRHKVHKEQYEYELIRYCNRLNLNVIGGASKLFKYFINEYSPTTILSFCDKRFFNGSLYFKLGFDYIKDTAPNYYYIKRNKMYNRTLFQKHLLKDKLEHFDSTLTEAQNMFNNGYRRIWDCGNMMFVWTKEKGA